MEGIVTNGSVLGITDFGSVSGSPLIPPSYLTAYFIAFLILLVVAYAYFYFKRRPLDNKSRVELLVILAIVINVTAFGGGSLLAGYWLIPSPGIRRTIPEKDSQDYSPTNRIDIVFDRPINRQDLEKSITPETPGRWVFEDSIYTTHLYRKLVFYPYYSLRPDTDYTVKLKGIRNMANISKPYNFEFGFKTQSSPIVPVVAPFNENRDTDVNSDINVVLDKPNTGVSEFSFRFEPEIEFETSLDANKLVYNLNPKTPLKQGTKYNLKIRKSDVIINLQDGAVVERGAETQVYAKEFTTREAPGIKSFSPEATNALLDSEVRVEFSKAMDKKSVEGSLAIEPKLVGILTWEGDSVLKYKSTGFSYDTEYSVHFKKGTSSLDGGFFEEDVVKSFKTIGKVKVTSIIPENNWAGVNVDTGIKITFDQEVDRSSVESRFSISPQVDGIFGWEGNTMTFKPSAPLLKGTSYNLAISQGVKSIKGLDSTDEFKSSFKTQEGTTKLAVPVYLQKYTLSCEIASLRMALNFKGLNLTEDEIIPKVGLDKTPHSGNVWGDPNSAFVGNIAGTQMVDGYGVHWGPIAKAARNYRDAEAFEGWSVDRLTQEIIKGNSIVIWVYSHNGTPTSWNTPDGKQIYAVRDEHAVTVVGFVGSTDNPTQLIINDPLSGQVYWSRSTFDKKWNIFGRSGVVVR